MDAQSRGRADDIDPADQWVLNPQTGHYELRLNHSEEHAAPVDEGPRIPRGRNETAAGTPRQGGRRRAPSPVSPASDDDEPPRGDETVPARRSRRAEAPKQPAQTSASRRRKAPKSRKKKLLVWTSGVTAFLVIAGAGGAYALYRHFNGNIGTIDVGDAGSKDVTGSGPMNILIIGTDKRTGEGNEGYGDSGSVGHADTNILFHVSADRTNATALSIPRDLMTDIPDCETKRADGTTEVIPGTENTRFNNSLGQEDRDPGCTMRTVKEITGLSVDHFMMVDFNAVKEISTAVGGVEVCMAKAIDDPKSHLVLPKGRSKVSGEKALALLRTRHSFGNESDLDRIKVQQQFLGSMIRQMKSDDTLTSPSKLFKLAEAATNALTVDSGIGSGTKLATLAKELAKVDTKNITFTTVPVIDNPDEPKPITVVLHPTDAEPLFSMMREDVSLTEVAAEKKAAADKKKSAQEALLEGARADAADVRVDVYNGGDVEGAAGATVSWLQLEKGVLKSTNKSNAPAKIARTTLAFAPDQADQARALADMMGLPASALQQGTADAEGLEAMTLTLGADFKGAGVSITAPKEAPTDIQRASADKAVCSE
ncbi:LCP family protein [Streptomyces sp. NBC_01218]|uniref:LCP family protein n=1 Tax=unclassified Streptomyces TaxID=2593676 RepID=UPI0023B977F0|nr:MULTISPECIES: LCP family protein [unclassified Streptomyces]WEH41521.1 LCP family protein [Streptomyces sp. AM 2-1-1]WSQ53149.1 LCP family protein [Streptomyces sp. NBC_01218]